jgi:hypothetical protein
MAFLRNDAINRVNLHSGIQALAQGAGGVFFLAFLLRAGVSVPVVLLAQAGIMAGRFALRPAILPLAKRFGMKPLLIFGAVAMAAQYPILAEVTGVGAALVFLCIATAVGELFYYLTYNSYFAVVGDAEHRGQQISAREALVTVVGIVAPLAGAWALLTIGPRWMFAMIAVIQILSAIPLIGAPNVPVKASAPGAFIAARLGTVFFAIDGWFDGFFVYLWNIALFVTLGGSIAAYGGAMALAGLAGAVFGLLLGRHIDAGHGRRAVAIAFSVAAAIVLFRAVSIGSPFLAVIANAIAGFFWPLLIPTLGTATYNLAKASPCPLRFHIASEGGWDVGCFAACIVAAGLAASGVPLQVPFLLALTGAAASAALLWRYYSPGGPGRGSIGP